MNAFLLRGLAVLALGLAACGAAVNLSGVGSQIGGVGSQIGQVARSVSGAAPTAVAGDQQAAVKQTIDRSNRAQADAFNTNNDVAMKPYATDSFYQQLLQTNRDLRSSGVTQIALVSTEYRDVTVDGSDAKATTLETWRSTYQDG